MKVKPGSDRLLNFKIILLLTFGQMGPVILSPAFHNISAYFQNSLRSTQLVVTLFFLGFAFGQLIYGPLANRLGRKKTFQWGISVSLIGTGLSIISVYVHSFELLLMGRFIEGLAASAGMVIGFTMLSDLYNEDMKRRIIGYSMLSFALMPAFATALSGFFVTYFNWQLSLWFLLGYGLFLLWYLNSLPETGSKIDAQKKMSLRTISIAYWETINNKQLILYSLLYGISNAGIYVFTTEGPMVGIGFLHLSSSTYGGLAASTFIGTIIGSLLTVILLKHFTANRTILSVYMVEILMSVGMLSCFYLTAINKMSLFIPIFVWFISNAILVSNAAALATSTAQDKATASSLMSFLANFICVIVTLGLSLTTTSSIYILPMGLVLLVLLGSPVLFKILRTNKSQLGVSLK